MRNLKLAASVVEVFHGNKHEENILPFLKDGDISDLHSVSNSANEGMQ